MRDLRPGSRGFSLIYPPELENVGGMLFFYGKGSSLWRSDGTRRGTKRLGGFGATWLTNAGGTLFFNSSDRNHGAELWRSNGTRRGTSTALACTGPSCRCGGCRARRPRPWLVAGCRHAYAFRKTTSFLLRSYEPPSLMVLMNASQMSRRARWDRRAGMKPADPSAPTIAPKGSAPRELPAGFVGARSLKSHGDTRIGGRA